MTADQESRLKQIDDAAKALELVINSNGQDEENSTLVAMLWWLVERAK